MSTNILLKKQKYQKNIATISGDEGAISIRDFAASELLPEDLEAAQKRAAELYEEIQQRKG
jgi:hypothetical protein